MIFSLNNHKSHIPVDILLSGHSGSQSAVHVPEQCPSRRTVLGMRSSPRPRPARSSLWEGGAHQSRTRHTVLERCNPPEPLACQWVAFPQSVGSAQRGMRTQNLHCLSVKPVGLEAAHHIAPRGGGLKYARLHVCDCSQRCAPRGHRAAAHVD